MVNLLDIFYNEIINEATNGKIDCGFIYNTIFSTNIENKYYLNSTVNDDELIIPTLNIKDKNNFDKLLIEYVEMAKDFYINDFEYLYDNEKEYIKAIMTLIWSNATTTDFNNPNDYLNKRIEFIKNCPFNEEIFFDSSLGNVKIKVAKEPIYEESPYAIKCEIDGNKMPDIKFGISEGNAYIYMLFKVIKIMLLIKNLNVKLTKLMKMLMKNTTILMIL